MEIFELKMNFFACYYFLDGPVFKTRPQSIEADNGASISLICDVVGNPPPDILWIHEPNDKVSSDEKFCCENGDQC